MIQEETILKGMPVSDGIAIGVLSFCMRKEPEVVESIITTGEVEREITRFNDAIVSSKNDLHMLQMTLEETGVDDAASIIDTHIQMLDDPQLKKTVEGRIRGLLKNTEAAFRTVVKEYEAKFLAFEDEYFKQRVLDIKDLSKRVLHHLLPRADDFECVYPSGALIYSDELVPSEAASAIGSDVHAFISQHGGGTSHTALIARACGIPFVSHIAPEALSQAEGTTIIIDGKEGILILFPTEETIQKYRRVQNGELVSQPIEGPVCTRDGTPVSVMANITSCEPSDLSGCAIADGVGLFRTEFLALGQSLDALSEEAQQEIYKQVNIDFAETPIVFRVFDFGAEKYTPLLKGGEEEKNPALGVRAIRFLFAQEALFRTQLRALMKAAPQKDLRILFPLIADPSDMVSARKIAHEEYELLPESARPAILLLGAMIELPSAVFLCEEIAKESDFISIGSNDLAQYTLGVDRSNRFVNMRYGALHPSLVRSLEVIVKAAERQNTPVSLCGEIASDPKYIPLLLGLGVRDFSCSPRAIPKIKEQIAQTDLLDAKALVTKTRGCATFEELEALLF